MRKKVLIAVCVVLMLTVVLSMAACSLTGGSSGGGSGKSNADVEKRTLAKVGLAYETESEEKDYKPMTSIRTLADIHFPEGIFDTGLGMYIYKNDDDSWVRTDTEEGKALFDNNRPTFISIHGMGGNAGADIPDVYYQHGYNVLCFKWGCYAGEENANVAQIVNKVWLTGYYWKDGDTFKKGARWETADGEWEENDISDACVIEMFCAYYYDFFKSFPDYAGSSIHIFGHSYGGMMSMGATSLLTTAFKCGVIPAYMLPDMVTMLDPFMMRASSIEISWLGADTPADGNICEVGYRTALDCQKLGITIRVLRASKSVSLPATLINFGLDFNQAYWRFINNVVYAHIDDVSGGIFSSLEAQHNYGWDWFTSYYTGYVLKDVMATETEEEALCFGMSYDASFARTGIKYSVNLNGTRDTNDDKLSSFYRTYTASADDPDYLLNDAAHNETDEEIATLTGKAKIAGFVYFDRNGDGKLNERVRDHFSGATVTVKDSSGAVILEKVTDVNGYYEIEVDEEGEYTVSVALPAKCSLSEGVESEVKVNIVDKLHQLALNNFGVVR